MRRFDSDPRLQSSQEVTRILISASFGDVAESVAGSHSTPSASANMHKGFELYYRLSQKELADLWQACVFVFDTNVLLDLYRSVIHCGRSCAISSELLLGP